MPSAATRAAVSPARLASNLRLTIARLARRIRQEGTSAGNDLTASRLAALTTIDAMGPLTLGELAAIEQVQPPSMTRIIARLEEGGLAARAIDATDRRIVRVQITEEGKRLLASSRTKRDAFLARQVARLADDEREILARALPILERLQEDD
jgi:DNA-binding MarR family transcriptional regulator